MFDTDCDTNLASKTLDSRDFSHSGLRENSSIPQLEDDLTICPHSHT